MTKHKGIFHYPPLDGIHNAKLSLADRDTPQDVVDQFLNLLKVADANDAELETSLGRQVHILVAAHVACGMDFGHFTQVAFAIGYLTAKGLI